MGPAAHQLEGPKLRYGWFDAQRKSKAAILNNDIL